VRASRCDFHHADAELCTLAPNVHSAAEKQAFHRSSPRRNAALENALRVNAYTRALRAAECRQAETSVS
jgi:hypothetical protein